MSLNVECFICLKSGMRAVQCPIQYQLDLNELRAAGKNCASEANSNSTDNITGVPFVASTKYFNSSREGLVSGATRNRSSRPWRQQREAKEI